MIDKNKTEFSFLKFPRALFDSPLFSDLSLDAKVLFALILDRMGVSEINADRFTDSEGNIFVIYTINEICEKLGCSHEKAVRLLKDLQKSDLILKYRSGCGKPTKIILEPRVFTLLKIGSDNSENQNSDVPKNGIQNFRKSESNYNNKSYNNISYIYPSIDYDGLIGSIEDQIEADCINGDAEIVKEIVMIMADVMSDTSPTEKIGRSEFPRQVVVSRFRKITAEHIENIIYSIQNPKYEIKNIKSYIISALYNAPATMASGDAALYGYYEKCD